MDENRIIEKMRELESVIEYRFKKLEWLSTAMQAIKIKEPEKTEKSEKRKHREYANEGLATVGDTVLKSVIADYLFQTKNTKTKGLITEEKRKLENNDVLYNVRKKYKIIDYAYNDKHFHSDPDVPKNEKVVDKKHDPYIEAIVGAIFYDSGYDTAKDWITKWLLPKLEQSSKKLNSSDNH